MNINLIFVFIIIIIIAMKKTKKFSNENLTKNKAVAAELNRKTFFRKSLRFEIDNLKLIKKNAKQIVIAKLQKEKNDDKKRVDAQFIRIWRIKQDKVHTKDVAARKVKKTRLKQIKKMMKNHLFTFVELLQLIHDLEIEWKRNMINQARKKIEEKSHVLKN